MASTNQLEDSLAGAFKSAPKLPENAKKVIVQWLPYINLILGVLSLWAAYGLWKWAHWASEWTDAANNLSRAFGGTEVVSTSRMSVVVWLALIVIAVEGVLYIMAFPGTKALKKSGWNLMFYALIVNAVYGVVNLFYSYGGVGSFLGYVIGTVIGLYFLFQIRDMYNGSKQTAAPTPPAASTTPTE